MAKYKLNTNTEERVPVLFITEDDLVKTTIGLEFAAAILNDGDPVPSDVHEGYGIKCDDFYFSGEIVEDEDEPKSTTKRTRGDKKA